MSILHWGLIHASYAVFFTSWAYNLDLKVTDISANNFETNFHIIVNFKCLTFLFLTLWSDSIVLQV